MRLAGWLAGWLAEAGRAFSSRNVGGWGVFELKMEGGRGWHFRPASAWEWGGGISEPREAQRGPERPSLDRTSLLCAWLAGWLAGGVAGRLRPKEAHATIATVLSSYASPLICKVAGFLNFGLLFHSCEHRSAHSCQLPRLPACFPAATKFATPCRMHPRGTKLCTPVSTFAPDVVPMIRPGPPGDCINRTYGMVQHKR